MGYRIMYEIQTPCDECGWASTLQGKDRDYCRESRRLRAVRFFSYDLSSS